MLNGDIYAPVLHEARRPQEFGDLTYIHVAEALELPPPDALCQFDLALTKRASLLVHVVHRHAYRQLAVPSCIGSLWSNILKVDIILVPCA